MNEIEALLEKIKKWILEEGGVVCPHKYGICKHDNENCPVFCIDQLQAKLGKIKKMDMDDLIDQFVGDLEFDVLIIWADILDVEHDEDMWLDDMWTDAESELRQKVAEAMTKVGSQT